MCSAMCNDKRVEFGKDSLGEGTFSPEAVADQHSPVESPSKSVPLLVSVSPCPHLLSSICIVQIVDTILPDMSPNSFNIRK